MKLSLRPKSTAIVGKVTAMGNSIMAAIHGKGNKSVCRISEWHVRLANRFVHLSLASRTISVLCPIAPSSIYNHIGC
jgi:hypothetical protein